MVVVSPEDNNIRVNTMLRVLLLCLLIVPTIARAGLANTLADNPSPYLAMHGGDPVAWQAWNQDAVAKARAENKLLFVSIGYFACHWCHVMQKESYQANDVAEVLNRDFVPVKVDRELNPALDARLIEFVERTRGYSGWPLNVFITPDGYPLIGIVYLPHDDFKNLVTELSGLWKQNSQGLGSDAKGAAIELTAPELNMDRRPLPSTSSKVGGLMVSSSLAQADLFMGGFGEQSKFPSVPKLSALLREYQHEQDEKLGKFLRRTLDNMQNHGLNDSLGGGFFRYTVDPQWRVPHFEKMLYDNALLASLYFEAATIFDEPRYRATALTTTTFMRETLGRKNGGLVASLSAVDDKNVEGGYYLWNLDEIKKALTKEEWRVAEQAWLLYGTPTLEGTFLPSAERKFDELSGELGLTTPEIKAVLASARSKLLKVRARRGLPVDDKFITAWNGLSLSAFVATAQATGNENERKSAQTLRNYIVNELWNGEKLVRARSRDGKVIGDGKFEDYAFVAKGLLDWAEYTGKTSDYKLVSDVIAQAWQRFFTSRGWKLSENSLLAYGESEAVISDGPLPSPAAVVLRVSQVLAGRQLDYGVSQQTFMAVLAASEQAVLEDSYWFASYVTVFEALDEANVK